SYVMLYSAEDRLFMTTCNRISSRDKKIIEDTFDLIQDYTLDQLRDAYRTALTNASFNEKGGAGLGLLDIAYRTQRVPEHAFKQVTGQDAFDFFIKVNLNLE
ncbi:MAG: hypothetical protein RL226_184, partial [Bacteroidota bacterium]